MSTLNSNDVDLGCVEFTWRCTLSLVIALVLILGLVKAYLDMRVGAFYNTLLRQKVLLTKLP
jgi:hypothetical protein